jgi:magnesium-transporting ATPase (P-type)
MQQRRRYNRLRATNQPTNRPPAFQQMSDLPARELVPGDIVELTVGDKVGGL